MRKTHVLVLAVLFTASLGTAAQAQRIIYVDDSATGTPDGTSWDTAWLTIQDAISDAQADQIPPDEIWVAAGTYKADYSGNEWATIGLKSGVVVYGGYVGVVGVGGERDTRNPDARTNGTVISGDLGGGWFSRTILEANNLADTTRLDGFEITGAVDSAIVVAGNSRITLQNLYIHHNTSSSSIGIGISISGNSRPTINDCYLSDNTGSEWAYGAAATPTGGDESYPMFTNCHFENNTTENGDGAAYTGRSQAGVSFVGCTFADNQVQGPTGGAIYHEAVSGSDPIEIRDCQFLRNTANTSGGAISASGGTAPMWIIACTFSENRAMSYYGGAVYFTGGAADSPPTLDIVNSVFTNNRAMTQGGAIFRSEQAFKATNCVFFGNESGYGDGVGEGGAICVSNSACQLINCTVASNYSNTGWSIYGGGFAIANAESGSLNAVNCIFWDNAANEDHSEDSQIWPIGPETTVTHSCVMDLYLLMEQTGNIADHPQFVGDTGELSANSPCVDAGSNEAVEADAKDADNDGDLLEATPAIGLGTRLVGYTEWTGHCTDSPEVDMGAYEFSGDYNGNGVADVADIFACDADPLCSDIDLNDDGVIDSLQDCNSNGIPDPCDIGCGETGGYCDIPGCGTSTDCNRNCIPDDCENVDCNLNGVLDECDIAAGTSLDCNENDVPDACEITMGTSADCNSNGIPDECDTSIPLTTKSTEFIVGFLRYSSDTADERTLLYLTSEESATVTITYPMGSNNSQIVNIAAGGGSVFTLPNDAANGWGTIVTANCIHVVSDKPISCVQLLSAENQTDAAIAFPPTAMGLEFLVMTADRNSITTDAIDRTEFLVFASEDNTTVNILPTVPIEPDYLAGEWFSVVLNRGEGFLARNASLSIEVDDVTGSLVVSDKPIGLVAGNECAFIPSERQACDSIFDVVPPVDAWDNQFALVELPHREEGSYYRIMVSQPNTHVTLDGEPLVLGAPEVAFEDLTPGQWKEGLIAGNHWVVADKPILIAQFMTGAGSTTSSLNAQDSGTSQSTMAPAGPGDPAMMFLKGPNRFLREHSVYASFDNPRTRIPEQWLIVIAKTYEAMGESVLLDGDPISYTEFSPIPTSGYSVAQISVAAGMHHVTSKTPHALYVAGYGVWDSYLYQAGSRYGIKSVGDLDGDEALDECECAPADLTQDGSADGEDIQDFIACVLGGDIHAPDCHCADMNSDEVLNSDDVPCFVQKLLTGVNGCEGTSGPRGDNDCNANMVDDAYDIATGYSNDANSNGVPDECEDCNSNGVPDDLDISQQTSTDVNSNGVPDDCERDCDGNGIPDAWEISQGLGADCNTNGQLDACESDCNGNGVPDDCDIDPTDPDGNGVVSPDCNGNEFPDECDLTLPQPMGSLDCNENGIPDECDIAACNGDPACDDCNENGYPDGCDIASGLSTDADANGVPDECETMMMQSMSAPPLGFDEEAAWAEFFEWSIAQTWGPASQLSGAAQFQAMLDKLEELGLPAERP